MAINDGSIIDNIQVVYGDEVEFTTLRTGDAVIISGEVVESKGNQDIEIKADSVELVNAANEEYPLQKKRHSVEYLREIAHLRPKTNLMMAVMKVRSVAAQAVHEFFAKNGYV